MTNSNLAVKRYDFDNEIFDEFNSLHYAKDLWPLVYILSDSKSKEAYVGETTDAYSRMKSHLKNDKKKKLTVESGGYEKYSRKILAGQIAEELNKISL